MHTFHFRKKTCDCLFYSSVVSDRFRACLKDCAQHKPNIGSMSLCLLVCRHSVHNMLLSSPTKLHARSITVKCTMALKTQAGCQSVLMHRPHSPFCFIVGRRLPNTKSARGHCHRQSDR